MGPARSRERILSAFAKPVILRKYRWYRGVYHRARNRATVGVIYPDGVVRSDKAAASSNVKRRNDGNWTSIRHPSPPRGASCGGSGGPSAKSAQLRFDRPYLPDACGLDPPRGHSLHPSLVDTDSKTGICFDRVVFCHRQLLHGDVLLSPALFVSASLAHKATAIFFRDRLLRLGLPFVIAAFTIMPIAYYESLRQHPDIGFAAFW